MQSIWRKSLLLSAMTLLAAAATIPYSVQAQQLSATRGGLGGIITDKSGAIIPGAKVTITGASDKRELTTDASGRFTASDLTPGFYTIKVEREGFQSQTAKNLEVVINKTSNVDLALTTGDVAQTVEVNAQTINIDTSSTAVSDNLTETFYQQVPIARGVGALFYVAPGVVDGGGTGVSNPSVGGATGLENLYLVDGVVLNDSGYGGLGVFSPVYGSLGTGINLSFIQEVQVKTAAYEPRYGGVNGGILQIVTKSGGSKFHGALAAYAAPEATEATPYYADNFRKNIDPDPNVVNSFQHGRIFAQPAYDASAELGGFIPIRGQHDRLFFFGSFNPSLNQYSILAPSGSPLFQHGPFTSSATTRSWASKVTLKITDGTSLDASAFGDPAHNNYTDNGIYVSAYPSENIPNTTAFSTWQYGSRAVVAHLSSSINATTQVNLAATYKNSDFTESGFRNLYQISDRTQGDTSLQGLGFYQNPVNKSYGTTIDIQKVVNLFGAHTFSGGFGFNRATYKVTKDLSGPRFPFPATNANGDSVADIGGNADLIGTPTSAGFSLRKASSACPTTLCPFFNGAAGRVQVFLRQSRGEFSSPVSTSSEGYLSSYVNDSYAIGRRITLNTGIRWEEEQLNGPGQQYVFVDNWSPRFGINIDPFGDRKTKVYFNWGRYTQGLPTDAAIRSLNNELDVLRATWAPPSDGTNLITNSDGTITPILDAAHLLSGISAYGKAGSTLVASSSTPEFISHGTKLNYEEEYLLGFQREVARGMVLDVRYSDRRLKRIIEDQQGVSPEGSNAGVANGNYVIGNPGPTSDLFTNEVEEAYTPIIAPDGTVTGQPADCVLDYGPQYDSLGNLVGAACGQNPNTAGADIPDGKPDGFATPIRRYQSLEVELNKNFSNGFLVRANYRFAKLYGNYEGLFRNDNGQSDPGISSLFDFTTGVIGLLGDQFRPGYLNTDRRNVANLYGSYSVPRGRFKKLTGGMGLRATTGTPVSRLASHPVYDNVGEIPLGGRGRFGTTPTALQLDLHGDYPVSLGERGSLKLVFDGFNVTDSRYIRTINQNIDTGFQAGPDPTFHSPTSFQRAFYARFGVRYEF